ncbi:MAG TPA: hypothetical protein VFI13_07680 [Gemmatimonadales bacterium]|nr:hypothetical protein [Gemmatimonadales bacterium]
MFSDPISHALSFAAKQLAQGAPRAAADLARPATLGVLLARYDCEEPVIQAGVLSEVLAQCGHHEREEVARRMAQKFGRVVHGIAVDALGPDQGPARRSLSRTWESAQCDVLEHFADAEPRTLDVRAGIEILACGALLTDVRRLGVEYLPQIAPATGPQLVWWFRSFAETLDGNEAWTRRAMLTELRLLTTQLAEAVG